MLHVLANIPFRFHWFLVVLMSAVIPVATRHTEKPGEFFPFSNFPMYSKFEPETYYVYVKDSKGEVVPVGTMFGRSISDLKKAYDRKLMLLKKEIKGTRRIELPIEAKNEAAREVLQWLVSITPTARQEALHKLSGLGLHEVRIVYKDSKISKTDTLVGELALSMP